MNTHILHRRLAVSMLCVWMSAFVPTAYAAETDATITLMPHCVDSQRNSPNGCPTFEVKDPETLQTATLVAGDILDMNIVIENPTEQGIARIRTWLNYDPTVLEGTLVTISKDFPAITPGESEFSEQNGTAMIEASAPAAAPRTDKQITFARVQFTVLRTPKAGTVISFNDVQPTGHTTVVIKENKNDVSILGSDPGSLFVRFDQLVEEDEPTAEETDSTETDATVPEEVPTEASSETGSTVPTTSVPSSPQDTAAFSLLQVQTVRATTDGSTVFLAWNPLQSSQLKGYNVYYGTVSGEYIQRRSVLPDARSLTIRALPVNTRYFFAVRAFNQQDVESAFSQEVAITVSDPSSSTAPLAPGDLGPNTSLPASVAGSGSVPGETGMSSTIALILFACASIGTLFAWKRQTIVTPSSHV